MHHIKINLSPNSKAQKLWYGILPQNAFWCQDFEVISSKVPMCSLHGLKFLLQIPPIRHTILIMLLGNHFVYNSLEILLQSLY